MIRGAFGWSGTSPHAFVRLVVRVPDLRDAWVVVDFMVDTGASHTVIHPPDLRRGFRMTEDEVDSVVARLGPLPMTTAGGVAEASAAPATLVFPHEDGAVHQMEATLRIPRVSAANRELPSLLGQDVLQHFRLVMTGSISVTLEPLPQPS